MGKAFSVSFGKASIAALWALFLAMACIPTAASAQAICQETISSGASSNYGAITITVPQAATAIPGTIIYDRFVSVSSTTFYNCTQVPTLFLRGGVVPRTPPNLGTVGGVQNVYSTGIPGIGVTYIIGQVVSWTDLSTVPHSGGPGNYSFAGTGSSLGVIGASGTRVQFVITGPVTAGTYNLAAASSRLPPLMTQLVFQNEAAPVTITSVTGTFIQSGTLVITSGTCSASDITVDLGVHQDTEFTGPGYMSAPKTFSITLTNCPAFYGTTALTDANGAALPNAPNTISLLFTPNPGSPVVDDPATYPGAIKISPASSGGTATGVAVRIAQIVNGNPTPITIGSAIPSNIALTPVPTTAGATYTVPMQARYVQTDNTVTAGQANASITLGIIYQ